MTVYRSSWPVYIVKMIMACMAVSFIFVYTTTGEVSKQACIFNSQHYGSFNISFRSSFWTTSVRGCTLVEYNYTSAYGGLNTTNALKDQGWRTESKADFKLTFEDFLCSDLFPTEEEAAKNFRTLRPTLSDGPECGFGSGLFTFLKIISIFACIGVIGNTGFIYYVQFTQKDMHFILQRLTGWFSAFGLTAELFGIVTAVKKGCHGRFSTIGLPAEYSVVEWTLPQFRLSFGFLVAGFIFVMSNVLLSLCQRHDISIWRRSLSDGTGEGGGEDDEESTRRRQRRAILLQRRELYRMWAERILQESEEEARQRELSAPPLEDPFASPTAQQSQVTNERSPSIQSSTNQQPLPSPPIATALEHRNDSSEFPLREGRTLLPTTAGATSVAPPRRGAGSRRRLTRVSEEEERRELQDAAAEILLEEQVEEEMRSRSHTVDSMSRDESAAVATTFGVPLAPQDGNENGDADSEEHLLPPPPAILALESQQAQPRGRSGSQVSLDDFLGVNAGGGGAEHSAARSGKQHKKKAAVEVVADDAPELETELVVATDDAEQWGEENL